MKNMKKLSHLGAVITGALLFTGAMSQTAHANILLGVQYESLLYSVSEPANSIEVFWEVNGGPGAYTYEYKVYNSPDAVDTVDSFNVGFDASNPLLYVPGTQTGGTEQINDGVNGLTWDFNPVAVGGLSPLLTFGSTLPPVLGNGNAADRNPPSPWASAPGGQQVAIPGIPDGGTTVALLGGALIGLGMVSKKMRM